jgi:putative hemolysin
VLVNILKKILGLSGVAKAYNRAVTAMKGRTVFESLAEEFDLDIKVSTADSARIPKSGPVLVVANHPMGAIDGVALGAFLATIRKDWKILSHDWFDRFPELCENMILVNPNKNVDQDRNASSSIKSTARWLTKGSLLAMYPSGTVSRLQWRNFKISDPPWQGGAAKLARLTRATILPIHIDGRNSWLFQAAALIHPKLTLFLLGWELLNKRRKKIGMQVGSPIPFDSIPVQGEEAITSYLREVTYQMA